MTGSPIFSVNFTNRKNPTKPDYHIMSDPEPAVCGISIICWARAFDVRDYFHDPFVGGKFY